METDAKIDWLSFTIERDAPMASLETMVGTFQETGQGRNGYTKTFTSETGAMLLSGGNVNMGTHIILTGSSLETIRNNGNVDSELCRLVLALSGKAARLDLAIDIVRGSLTVQDCEDAWMSREMVTPAKSSTRITSFPRGGNTLYIGSRSSERMLRIYDKAVEQDIVDQGAWLRLELEIKKLRARATLGAIGTTPQTRWVINRAFRDFCDWDNSEFRTATDDNFAEIATIPRKMPNLLHWLQTQVAPAAARYQNEHAGVDIRAILNTWIGAYLIDNEDIQQ
jgi:DNA relaxase NicK